jgi:hypothetical protein
VLAFAATAGRRLWVTAILLQAGVTGLFVSLLLRSRWSWVGRARVRMVPARRGGVG